MDFSGITLDTTPVFTLAGIVIAGIMSVWVIRKIIKLGNKS